MIRRTFQKIATVICIATLSTLFFFACETDDDKNAKVQVWLTDAPGDYEAVYIDIQGVEVHTSETADEKGWQSLDIREGVYDLLQLTNGLDTLLGEVEIPAGKISQIRLVLGSENSIKVSGKTFDLGTPSAQQSGLKLQIHETLNAGVTYKILLDFDVARSIVLMGNETYKLKPVIRTITEAQDGAIKGLVSPKESTPAVYAIVGDDTLATSFADANGAFLLRGLPADTYVVSVVPNSNYAPTQKNGVVVTLGNVTDLGTITLPQ
ncbi:DUF4382 domain-containing protein [Pseudochryseolinea flava]|uniref:DUF4382 domain-containing protein n=1 Tax=Pseudochryseolinea flava TaxID=2059302 RepID=A0A364Y9J2_9BACT|nr:DUF4382 domain-containing protein [Pseudochryseolinea flava]RAW03125.1 hypothetical protein DQQ10_03240 [Pseudochryseolinea flava]